MKYELWYSKVSGSGLLLAEGDQAWDHLKGPDAKVIWSDDAANYQEARAKRDEFCARSGFEPLGPRPMKESTTRLICVVYQDGSGQHRAEFPGWEPVVPRMAQFFGELDGFDILGQVFIERPYRDLADIPDELTVVELHSADGLTRMYQEFVGNIDGQIAARVSARLGQESARWTIKDSKHLKRTRRSD